MVPVRGGLLVAGLATGNGDDRRGSGGRGWLPAACWFLIRGCSIADGLVPVVPTAAMSMGYKMLGHRLAKQAITTANASRLLPVPNSNFPSATFACDILLDARDLADAADFPVRDLEHFN